jgi:hypothetical protein
MIQEEVYEAGLSILLSLYPKILAIASGATPIGSAVAHPIERSRQKEKKQGTLATLPTKINIDYSHREIFMKVKKDNSKNYIY